MTQTLIALTGFRIHYESLHCTAADGGSDGDNGENVLSLTLVFRTKLGVHRKYSAVHSSSQIFSAIYYYSYSYFIVLALQPFVGPWPLFSFLII
jgi:hypothetical protein